MSSSSKILRRHDSESNTVRKTIEWLGVFFVVNLLGIGVSVAAGYRMDTDPKKGVQIELMPPSDPGICEAYQKAVIDYQKIAGPMACERPIDPTNRYFSTPKWRVLSMPESMKLAEAVARYELKLQLKKETDLLKRTTLIQKRLAMINEGLREGYLTYQVAEFELTQIEGSDQVLRVTNTNRDCSGKSLLFGRQGNTRLYVFVPNAGGLEILEAVGGGAPFQAFFYKNRTYLDRWWASYDGYRAIIVYETGPSGGRRVVPYAVCRFAYTK